MTKREKLYYTICAIVLIAFLLGFGAWLMFSTYPAVLYP